MKKTIPFYVYLLFIILFLSISYSVLFIFDSDTAYSLGKEDGLFEDLSALFFLAASICFFGCFFLDKSANDFFILKTKRNYFYLLFFIIFFLAFAEEISWGQRILGFQTPEALNKINVNQEFNIHNIFIFDRENPDGTPRSFFQLLLSFSRLFMLFWLTYCLVIPFLCKIRLSFYNFIKRINLPIVPLEVGIFFPINYISFKIIHFYIIDKLGWPVNEIKECNFAFLFFLISLYFFIKIKKKNSLNKSPQPQ